MRLQSLPTIPEGRLENLPHLRDFGLGGIGFGVHGHLAMSACFEHSLIVSG